MQTDSLQVLTKDDLVAWYLNPVTKKVRYKVDQEIGKCRDRLADGWTLDLENIERTPVLTAREVGKIDGLRFLLGIESD